MKVTDLLVSQPETGMGWQLVQVTTPSGESATVRIINAEFLVRDPARQLARESLGHRREDPVRTALIDARPGTEVKALNRDEAVMKGLVVERAYGAKGKPASEGSPEVSRPDEEFRRFSAFENDRRINADGSVASGPT